MFRKKFGRRYQMYLSDRFTRIGQSKVSKTVGNATAPGNANLIFRLFH